MVPVTLCPVALDTNTASFSAPTFTDTRKPRNWRGVTLRIGPRGALTFRIGADDILRVPSSERGSDGPVEVLPPLGSGAEAHPVVERVPFGIGFAIKGDVVNLESATDPPAAVRLGLLPVCNRVVLAASAARSPGLSEGRG
jgi:hypothetical protein